MQVFMHCGFIEKLIDSDMIVTINEIGEIQFFSALELFISFVEFFGFIVVAGKVNVEKTCVRFCEFLIHFVSDLIACIAVVSQHAGAPHLIVINFGVKSMIVKVLVLVD